MRYWTFLLVVTFSMNSYGQGDEAIEKIRNRFPDESAVFLDRSMTLNLVIDGDSLKAYADVYEDLLHLKSQTDDFAKRKVYGSHFTRVENLKAKTLVWDKNKYRELPVNNFKKSADPDRGVFFDDGYYYAFDFPSVASGNRTQLQYREIQKEVRFISGFLFASYLPQVRSSFKIKTTKDVDLHFQVLNDPTGSIKFRKKEIGKTVEYEWVSDFVPAANVEDDSPSIRYYEPHVACHVISYKGKSGVVSVLPDVKALFEWYQSFVKDLDEPDAPALAEVVNSIKAQSNSEEETVKNIFYWVQRNIQYIAFEDGMRGFVPHKASYTFEKRYGDCKDMANLIVGMLKVAGIKGYHTWIGTRDIPYRYKDFPAPFVDNHMIATYISQAGRYYFLDATSKYSQFGFPSSMIQGKEALIAIDRMNFEVREVPEINKKENLITDSIFVALENNEIKGYGKFELHGLAKSSAGYRFDRVEEKDIKDYISFMVGKGSNKFYLDKYKVSTQLNHDQPTQIDYTFRIGDYYQTLGDEMYINLNLTKDNYNRFINEETRKTPHEFDFKYEKAEVIEFKLPEGYEVEYLPPNDAHQGELLGYTITYELSGNRIFFRKSYYVDYLLMNPIKFKTWNDDVSKISNAYRETIILKKKKQ
jgi:hypothetical protein